jgi:hypothetical protein
MRSQYNKGYWLPLDLRPGQYVLSLYAGTHGAGVDAPGVLGRKFLRRMLEIFRTAGGSEFSRA